MRPHLATWLAVSHGALTRVIAADLACWNHGGGISLHAAYAIGQTPEPAGVTQELVTVQIFNPVSRTYP